VDYDRGVGCVVAVVINDCCEEVPLGGSHGSLDEMVFGEDFVAHDETRVDDDG